MKETTRRALLKQAGCGLLGRAALISGFDRFSLVSALAAPIAPTDYKALVCIFMFGGNDANNTLISLDNFSPYSTSRGILAFTQAQLAATAINPKKGGHYALHPSMTGLASLFNSGKVAALVNVGTLTWLLLQKPSIKRVLLIPTSCFRIPTSRTNGRPAFPQTTRHSDGAEGSRTRLRMRPQASRPSVRSRKCQFQSWRCKRPPWRR